MSTGLLLLESQSKDIYLKIKKKSEDLNLPINDGQHLVGFGLYDDFYMFFIKINNNGSIFSARIKYDKKTTDNIIRFPMEEQYIDDIFTAIDNIYSNYNEVKDSIKNQEETPRFIDTELEESEKELEISLNALAEYLDNNENTVIEYISDKRVKNLLEFHQIVYYGDFLPYSARQIREWKNCGKKSIRLIAEIISNFTSNNNNQDTESQDTTKENAESLQDTKMRRERYIDRNEKKLDIALAQLSEYLKTHEDKKIEHISNNRVKTLFIERNITFIGDLLNYNANQIRRWRNCGNHSMKFIICLINDFINTNSTNFTAPVSQNERYSSKKISNSPQLRQTPEDQDFLNFETDLNRESELELLESNLKNFIYELIEKYNERIKDKRYLTIWKEYLLNDNKTYQEIGDSYNITRERVRQIVNKVSQRLKWFIFRNKDNIEYTNKILEIFDNVEINGFTYFVAYQMLSTFGKRTTNFILSGIYKYPENIINNASILLMERKKALIITKSAEQKEHKNNKWFESLISEACFPSNKNCMLKIDSVQRKADCLSFAYKDKVIKKFSEYKKLKRLVIDPDIVYSFSTKKEFIPDFLIETEDGKIILFLVMNTVNMGLFYNIKRFNDLHVFCKNNGIGYIIMNPQYKTIFKIMQTELREDIVKELNELLEDKGIIVWDDILLLKEKYEIGTETMVAYVLKNKLHLSLRPYLIKKRT